MRIFCIGDKPRRQPSFVMCVAPAATLPNQEVPAHWVEQSGDKIVPVQFNIEFVYGESEVEDGLAQYMIANGLAKRTRLLMPRLEASDPSVDPLQLGH